MSEVSKEKKEAKKGKTLMKKFLIYLPVLIILIVVIFFIMVFVSKKQTYSVSEYENKLSKFYFYLATKDTNNLLTLINSKFENKEAILPINKDNYKLFSYNFEFFTNEIESNKVEGAKLLYSIFIETKSSNISIIKEAYFSTTEKKIMEIKELYQGKDITKIK